MEQKIWWYVVNNEQKGPVSEQELNLLVNQNFMSAETLVWKEGLPEWKSFKEMNAPVDKGPVRPPVPAPTAQTHNTSASTHSTFQQQNSSTPPPNQNYQQQHAPAQPAFASAAGTSFSAGAITDPYYKYEFDKIAASNESYKGKWNWWSFFFSWVWCFTKGLWQYGLAVILIIFALPYFLPFAAVQVFSLGVAIFFGTRGTYLFYQLKMKNKQLF